jgi:hypothetical protein
VSFKQAVEATPQLKDAYCAGLQALQSAHKRQITAADTRQLDGSVDFDSTLKDKYPNASRWDYAIGHADDVIYWIEVHPATSGEIDVVLAKLDWLLGWLRQSAPKLDKMRREFIWISSGKTTLTPDAPQKKRIAQRGLQQKGRFFRIPKNAAA